MGAIDAGDIHAASGKVEDEIRLLSRLARYKKESQHRVVFAYDPI